MGKWGFSGSKVDKEDQKGLNPSTGKWGYSGSKV